MKIRGSTLVLVLALAVGCESSTTPDVLAVDPDALADEVLTLASDADTRRGDRVPLLHRLLRRSLHAVAEQHGADAARTAASRLRELAGEVRRARETGDREAFRSAVAAFETAGATLVIRVLGDAPAGRVLRANDQQLQTLRQEGERLAAGGGDATRIHRILRATVPDHRAARAAWGDGDPVTALRLAARVHDLLRRAGT